jgi:hypothetical protein
MRKLKKLEEEENLMIQIKCKLKSKDYRSKLSWKNAFLSSWLPIKLSLSIVVR